VRREVLRMLNDTKKTLKETAFTTETLTELFKLLDEKAITDTIGQQIIEKLAEKEFSPKQYVEEQGLGAVSDEGELKKFCEEAIAGNEKAVNDYKKGEEKALQFLIGQVMRKTKGTATPQIVRDLLLSLLK